MIADNDGCPVPDELIGRLYGAPMHRIDGLVSPLPSGPRGHLAAFCYGRAHLRDIGLAIAATCDLETLVNAGGRAGNSLFAASRERPHEVKQPFSWSRRSRISLATTGMAVEADMALEADMAMEADADMAMEAD
jgi:hypothetical protein